MNKEKDALIRNKVLKSFDQDRERYREIYLRESSGFILPLEMARSYRSSSPCG